MTKFQVSRGIEPEMLPPPGVDRLVESNFEPKNMVIFHRSAQVEEQTEGQIVLALSPGTEIRLLGGLGELCPRIGHKLEHCGLGAGEER